MRKELELGGFSERREQLYNTAYACLGTDASPRDMASDDLGCAESVNAVYKACFGHEIGGDVSTLRMYQAILANPQEFQEVERPLHGDIIISPTAYVNASVGHGHVGVVGKWQIMSNNSANGKWEAYYTLDSWIRRYGFVKYFRPMQEEPAVAPPAVEEIVEKTVEVAREAVKYPALIRPVLALLATLASFLSKLKLKL